MPQWRMITEWLQAIADANVNNVVAANFNDINRVYKLIVLAHYEEIYG